jgi:hypothetical protein
MISMKKGSRNVEQESTAKANEDQILLLSRELAVKLGTKKANFNASLILYGLYLWQKTPVSCFGYVPKIEGQRACYRSLSELHEQYPWLSEEAIRKILVRAERVLNGHFVIDRDNPNAERGKHHFWLSPTMIKKYGFNQGKEVYHQGSKGALSISKAEVLQYGVLEAVLLNNLRYVTDEERNNNPVTDEKDNIYRELSPTKLTRKREDKNGDVKPILPVSRKLVTEALKVLKAAGAIQEHVLHKHFYRLTKGDKTEFNDVTKVATDVTKVASRVTKVARQTAVMPCNISNNNDLRRFSGTSNRNTNRNPNRKCLLERTASLRFAVPSISDELSAGAKKLMEFVANEKQKAPQKAGNGADMVFGIEDYDKGKLIGFETHYDFFPIMWYSGKPFARSAEIDECMDQMILDISLVGLSYGKKDLSDLRQLFVDHDALMADHLIPVLHSLTRKRTDIMGRKIREPKKGTHDFYYWARRISNLRQFLHYLPQLLRETYVNEAYGIIGHLTEYEVADNGKPIFDYAKMPEPLLSMAFANDHTTPITNVIERNEQREWIDRPVFYPEWAGLPVKEYVTHDSNPMMDIAA